MRQAFSIIFILLSIALGTCAATARRSGKVIAPSVAFFLSALIPPVIGNLIIVMTGDRSAAAFGCYTYFLGMDLTMFGLIRFTFDYCFTSRPNRRLRTAAYALLAVDAVQLLLNPFFHHAFDTEPIIVDGFDYYRLVPHLGQTFHRVVDYGILAVVLGIFLYKIIRSPRIYVERYFFIFLTMCAVGVWETFYIFSRTPIDRSMIGFGVYGLLVYYFALFYRPRRLLDRMLANIASQMQEALFFFDAGGRCIWANRPGIDLVAIENDDFEPAAGRLRDLFGDGVARKGEWSERRELGAGAKARFFALERHAVSDDRGRPVGAFLSVRDDTEEQLAVQRDRYNARHDPLTGLYTREYLYKRVQALLADQPQTRFALIFVDVKDFKIVNDIFGNDFGDYALQRIADWIRGSMSENSVYGRLAGDTFGICRPASEFDPAFVENRLASFRVSDGTVEHPILIHLGVYEVTEPGLDVSVMFDRAHMALSTIENDYKRHIAFYDDTMRSRVLWNQHITAQLHDALAQRQLIPYLQPVVDRTGRVVGAEALARWIHPVDGFLPPSAFIPLFEQNGMIAEVDRHMWRCACEMLSRWDGAMGDLFISVNISPRDFYFMDVAAEILGIVAEYGVDPSRLCVEITETVMMTDVENRMHILDELRHAGFTVEIDDFGSGYSSLNMLKDLPADVLKIDMMFLNQSKNDLKSRTILNNILRLSEDLGITSLTEGVETQAQMQMLGDMGCRLFQGYYFAKPMPEQDFIRFVEEHKIPGH